MTVAQADLAQSASKGRAISSIRSMMLTINSHAAIRVKLCVAIPAIHRASSLLSVLSCWKPGYDVMALRFVMIYEDF